MPKVGMEPIRRKALIEATMRAIHAQGYCGVTIGAIAREAKVSNGLAHHYFGSKEQLLAATMRALYQRLGADIQARLAAARTPRDRLSAIIRGNLSAGQFEPAVVSAWLAFYMQAQTAPATRHLLRVYYRRLQSNLVHALRMLVPLPLAKAVAEDIGALIDGLYLRQALGALQPEPEAAIARVEDYLSLRLREYGE
ncbi:MAG TPA: transcriptional regulator BetI [Paracoccaceae bacterium]|nr:transcriptional regulator BetI [Paracoccaceae bacterium]